MKKKYLLLLYLVFVACLFMTSSTLSKYVSTTDKETSFVVGNNLFIEYKRGNLYRNKQLIVGKDVTYEQDGEVIHRIETMNLAPKDTLVYHFYITNYGLSTDEKNNVDGLFYPQAGATLEMPMIKKVYNINCTISYRPVNEVGASSSTPFALVTDDIDLPKFSDSKMTYEFKIEVRADQVEATTHDDYFGSTLTIYIFIDAASDLPTSGS